MPLAIFVGILCKHVKCICHHCCVFLADFSWVKLIVCCRCHISNQFRIALFWAPFKVFVAFRGMVSIHIFVSIGVHIRIIDSNTTQIGYTKRRVQLIQLPKVFVINLGISYRKSISAIDCL